jgi:hypothetical protein
MNTFTIVNVTSGLCGRVPAPDEPREQVTVRTYEISHVFPAGVVLNNGNVFPVDLPEYERLRSIFCPKHVCTSESTLPGFIEVNINDGIVSNRSDRADRVIMHTKSINFIHYDSITYVASPSRTWRWSIEPTEQKRLSYVLCPHERKTMVDYYLPPMPSGGWSGFVIKTIEDGFDGSMAPMSVD